MHGRHALSPGRAPRQRADRLVRTGRRLVATSALVVGLTACVSSNGAAELAETATPPAPLDPIDVAAYAALAAGMSDWTEPRGGATGTVEALGEAEEGGCRTARLTIHDFTGLRIEERRLCPPPFGP